MSVPSDVTAQTILAPLRSSTHIHLTTTGPRDTGQSDYKNRHTFQDLIQLAPFYEEAGYFSVEMHGGARFHQNMLNNMINPFEEAAAWKAALGQTRTQTLLRSTNAWGYRAYPENVLRLAVRSFLPYIDIWRCFDFLNYVPNMRAIAEEVQRGEKLFQPALSFTQSDDCTDAYYLGVANEMIALAGGAEHLILGIKDMAGVGSPTRIRSLIDTILQAHPDLIIQYHRHNTDGLGIPALLAAAQAGARILDVAEGAFVRFYGQPPVLPMVAMLQEAGLEVAINQKSIEAANDVIRGFIGEYEAFESQLRGPAYDVLQHRMPGGAFPSSFEQAEKNDFLPLMPQILKGMSYGNQIIKYFDVTPGSQITWTTWASIIQREHKEGGMARVTALLQALQRFIDANQALDALNDDDKAHIKGLYAGVPDDLRKLLVGDYGPLPFGWPADWVYHSAFGPDKAEAALNSRREASPSPAALDIEEEQARLAKELGRDATDQELCLYLQHPAAAVKMLQFRQKYGDTTSLPTHAWFYGLTPETPEVQFMLHGKPHVIKLISKTQRANDIQVLLSVDNVLSTFNIPRPDAQDRQSLKEMADPSNSNHVAATMNGNLWRIGSGQRRLQAGDQVKKGEELANIEVMKTENAIYAPFAATIVRIVPELNDALTEGQLLFELKPDA